MVGSNLHQTTMNKWDGEAEAERGKVKIEWVSPWRQSEWMSKSSRANGWMGKFLQGKM